MEKGGKVFLASAFMTMNKAKLKDRGDTNASDVDFFFFFSFHVSFYFIFYNPPPPSTSFFWSLLLI